MLSNKLDIRNVIEKSFKNCFQRIFSDVIQKMEYTEISLNLLMASTLSNNEIPEKHESTAGTSFKIVEVW